MVLHIWMHWFWITSFVRRGLLLLVLKNLICSPSFVAEAGLLGTSFMLDSGLNGTVFNIKGNTSQNNVVDDMKELWRRGAEGGGDSRTESVTSFLPPRENGTVSNADHGTSSYVDKDSDYSGITASDMDDTYNGATLEGYQYPLKKYSKYTTFAKYKTKSKSTENERDAANSAEEKFDADIKEESSGNGNDREVFPHLNDTQTVLNSTLSGDNLKITEKPAALGGNSSMSNGADMSNRTIPADGIGNTTENGVGVDEEKKNLTDSATNVTEKEMPSDGGPKEVNLNIENKVADAFDDATVEPFLFNNRVAAATSSESRKRLSQPSFDAGSITGITLGIIVVTCSVGAISFLLYRRRYLNKPQALNDKCSNLDSSGYIDDTSLRENSEEMYSLDNDSFLNSLEAMTIQNYWTENVKHTKL